MEDAFAYVINRTASLYPPTAWKKLTPREREIAKIICQANGGRLITNPQIADKLGISRETVKIHIRNILDKFDLHSKSELRQTLISWEIVNYPRR
jgi:DNA-binding CsgD family transcriptional regulator